MRVMEFVGLPGSGKTSTLRELQKISSPGSSRQFVATKEVRRSRLEACAHIARTAVESADAIRCQIDLYRKLTAFGYRERGLSSHMLRQALLALRLATRIDRHQAVKDGQVLIMDQGLVQLIGSLAVPSRAKDLPKPRQLTIALCSGRVDGLVWVDCKPNVAFERIRHRFSETNERHRFLSHAGSYAFAVQDRMGAILRSTVDELARSGVPVLRVGGEDDVLANVKRIDQWMCETWGF